MISLENVQFSYSSAFSLKIAGLTLAEGETLAVTGVSGSGKSTLLRLLSGELQCGSGQLSVLGRSLDKLNSAGLRSFRLKNLGMIFQDSPLLDYLNLEENILLPAKISGLASGNLNELSEKCGIKDLLKRKPGELSEGEKQRAGICRALITSPQLVLADEPTSSLDPERGRSVTELLIEGCRSRNASLVMVTHDHTLLDLFDRSVDISELGGSDV
jgi:putative ABC transport system ATP-binding protein